MSTRRPKFVRFNRKCRRIYEHKKAREKRRLDAQRLERRQGRETYVYVHGTRVADLVVRKSDGALGTLVPDGFVFADDGTHLLLACALKHWPSGLVETNNDFVGAQRIRFGDWVEEPKYDTIDLNPSRFPLDSPEAALEAALIDLRWMLEDRAELLRELNGERSCQYGGISRDTIREQVAKVRELRKIAKTT